MISPTARITRPLRMAMGVARILDFNRPSPDLVQPRREYLDISRFQGCRKPDEVYSVDARTLADLRRRLLHAR